MKNKTVEYTTGEFAKLANVTIRTIRYYDKVGLLKPSFIMKNGYRKYTDKDFIKLQKIISLKHLGFSLEEIYPLLLDESETNIQNSLDLQLELINKKINHLQSLKDSLKSTKLLIDNDQLEWSKIIELLQLSNKDETIVEQYKSSKNLNVRIALHKKYSVNKIGWFQWLYNQIDFSNVNKLLEVGCGNGEIWKYSKFNMRNREIYLSDISEGMMDDVKSLLNDDFSYFVFNCENIPFKKDNFDAVMANHVLFYLRNVNQGLKEIARVLKKDGMLYSTTYGANHMKEINDLVKEFDSNITLSEHDLYMTFGLENGCELLKPYFKNIKKVLYDDSLIIKDSTLLLEYIISSYGNQNEIIGNRHSELKEFLDNKIRDNGQIVVSKEVGLFVCQKK